MTALREWFWDLRCRMRIRERATTGYWHCRSLLSRRSLIKDYLESSGSKKLQIGCGRNRLSGWLNTDLVANHEVVYMDATKPLPFPDNSLDCIFSEHIFEHISYRDGSRFLKECHRTLKPEGRIRISTPDLAFLIRLYNEPETDVSKRYIKFAIDTFINEPKVCARAVVVNNFFYNWGHQFIYDYEILQYTLHAAGFKKIIRFKPGESNDLHLKGLESHGKIIGEEFNLLESIVVEAEKA